MSATCGTISGYSGHRKRSEQPCDPCKAAWADYQKAYRASDPSSTHHRKLRSQGGLDEPDNLIRLCGSGTTGCHGWAHANPAVARSYGLIVWRIRNPAEVPVRKFHGWVLLDAQGGETALTDEAALAAWERLDAPPEDVA
jgi:hypothetical protein